MTFTEPAVDFTANPSWIERQQNRWLAWVEFRRIINGRTGELSFSDIEEVAGMLPWEGRAIMDQVSEKQRKIL